MFLIRILIFVVLFSLMSIFIKQCKNIIMKKKIYFFDNFKFNIRRIYRIVNVKKCSEFVWKDLIKYYKESGLNFGQFDIDKRIEIGFEVYDSFVKLNYTITNDKLIFSAIILNDFDEDKTNDIMVLASHFNGLLNFGVVKVSLKYNYVEFIHSGDLITYMLYPGEICSDISTHFSLTKDCLWSFKTLIETGDDPVFVFSELLKYKEEENNQHLK